MIKPGVVSVMMPAYNAEAYIDQAIESLLAQQYAQWELIVVNDGSTDGTAAVVERWRDSRISLFQQANGGEAAARNVALRQMQGEFVAFLDADDLYLPQHLAATVGYLQAHPACDGVYTDGYYCDQQGRPLQTLASRRRGPLTGPLFEEAVRASNVFGPPLCVVLRRSVITQKQIWFDEAITIGPDWVFLIEYADGSQFGYLDQATCLYRIHQSNITVRVGLVRRARELAKCRMRAIKMPNFQSCSVATRTAVFYDLLVTLLRGAPEEQSAITRWPEFQALPFKEQARLLRLMVSKSLLYASHTQGEQAHLAAWLHRSRQLNPNDWAALVVAGVYAINPLLCQWLLRLKTRHEVDPLTIPPFADLQHVAHHEG